MSMSTIRGGIISNPSSIYNQINQIEPKNLSEKLDNAEFKENINLFSVPSPNISDPILHNFQSFGEVTDKIMMSDEAQEEMNYIGGTDGNDKIKASINKENGNIIINVNGQEKEYTPEEAANGFKIDSGNGNDDIDISAILNNFVINAGEGDNNINLGQGRNVITTGDGNNTITANEAKRNKITTGNGNNEINLTGERSINTVNTGSGKDNITINGEHSDSNINSGAGDDKITAGNGRNTIYGENGNDIINTGNGNNIIDSGSGSDKIKVGNGNNTINGGNEADIIEAGDGNNTINGGDGNDTIKVGNGNGNIINDNTINGGSGNDIIVAGNGKNIINGGDGNDIIKAGNGRNTIDGGDGDNKIIYDNLNSQTTNGNLSLSDEATKNMLKISGTDGNDKISASINKENGNIVINVNGKEQEYTADDIKNGIKIDSGNGNDKIDLSAVEGKFVINAGEGNNNLNLSKGENFVNTGNGNNIITAKDEASKNTISTGRGRDIISVNGQYNNVNSGAGTDFISTNGKESIVNSGEGNDIVFSNGEKNNINAGNGNDIVFSNGKNDDIHGGRGNDLLIAGNETASLYGDKGNDTIIAGNGDNYIEGGIGNDNIIAGNGNNTIYGVDGNDFIKAGNGNNYIDGGKGNDFINVGNGKNTIFGGKGFDFINAKNSSGKVFDDNYGMINASKDMDVKRYNSSNPSNLGKSINIEGSDDFKARVESDLEALRATESGKKLLTELDRSGKTVTINQTNDSNGYEKTENYNAQFVTPDGQRGIGSNATISYNPSYNGPANGRPLNVLFHEGIHSYNTVTGTMQPGETHQEPKDDNGLPFVNSSERQAVGLSIDNGIEVTHPDGTKSANNPEGLTENAIRAELGIEARTKY